MKATNILDFLARLKDNNNREWFGEHKEEYLLVKEQIEHSSEIILNHLKMFDESLQALTVKDCIFRIYRDIRFSYNKAPYKTHVGVFFAPYGGRKSQFAGYYLHLEPDACELIPGVYCPSTAVLKELRWAIVDNYDEWSEIVNNVDFKRYYTSYYEEGKLKRIPAGFPSDFEGAELLKLKHIAFRAPLPTTLFAQENWEQEVAHIFQIAYPAIRFINYTIEETLNT